MNVLRILILCGCIAVTTILSGFLTSCGNDNPNMPESPVVNKWYLPGVPDYMEPFGCWTTYDLPKITCTETTEALRNILVSYLIGEDYMWQRLLTDDGSFGIRTVKVLQDMSVEKGNMHGLDERLHLSNAKDAIRSLTEGDIDFVISDRDLTPEELRYCDENQVRILSKPIAKDALVFFSNRIWGDMSSDDIRDVYAGKVNNWREVGSQYSGKIVAFVSEKGMGDREIFDKLVMNGVQIGFYNNGATIRETHSLYRTFLDMQRLSPKTDGNGMAFSSLYYYETLVESRNFRALNVDGVRASKNRVKDGTYPYITNVYVMVRDERDTGTNARRLYDFMTSEAGQEIVEESGYIMIGI